MRLWPIEMLSILPKKQLMGQWKELATIRGSILKKGTPNHLLVNKILEYSKEEWCIYNHSVYREMKKRGFNPTIEVLRKNKEISAKYFESEINYHEDVYTHWHNERYLRQCYYNLEEKYDCGGIPKQEWANVEVSLRERVKG